MTDFDDILSACATDFDVLGAESITVTDINGTQRTINALIDRDPPQRMGPDGLFKPKLTIDVANSATTGVSVAAEIIGITFTVPIRRGHATTQDHAIRGQMNVASQDAGRVVFTF